jgi:hypothetical protein
VAFAPEIGAASVIGAANNIDAATAISIEKRIQPPPKRTPDCDPQMLR